MAVLQNHRIQQQQFAALSSSWNADAECLYLLRCKKEGTLNVSTRTEPLHSLLAEEEGKHAIRTYVDACSELVYRTEHTW